MSDAWYASLFTGLFTASGPVPLRAHDPDVPVWSCESPLAGPELEPLATGGAGWDAEAAEAAGVGEAIERWQTWPLPGDRAVTVSYKHWPLDESAIAPDRWVLFHPEQYALPDFRYPPFTPATECRWVCARQAITGLPFWVPEDFIYLSHAAEDRPQLCPRISSGLDCGRWNHPVVLRGLQELIERDAAMGAAWECYPLQEHDAARVFAAMEPILLPRLIRPNLRYRFFRVMTPFSAHVTLATLEGEDREGYCFSVGSACRETRTASWKKSLLEAVQGRHYVRYLKTLPRYRDRALIVPTSFADHAVYYSLHPEWVSQTVLGRPRHADGTADAEAGRTEDVAALVERLGPQRPVLFRNMTPPGLAIERLDWQVLRVLVPGLQPLHGHHALPFLGGPLWAPRGWADWAKMLPHLFP